MKAVALFALLAPVSANAHYVFNRLIVNLASIGGKYAYLRKNSNAYNSSFPSELMKWNGLRCNKGAKAGNTATYTVKAGDNWVSRSSTKSSPSISKCCSPTHDKDTDLTWLGF